MGLAIRMILYFLSALLAGQGIAVFDQDAGTVTIQIEDATTAISGLLVYLGTFVSGRWFKARGGSS